MKLREKSALARSAEAGQTIESQELRARARDIRSALTQLVPAPIRWIDGKPFGFVTIQSQKKGVYVHASQVVSRIEYSEQKRQRSGASPQRGARALSPIAGMNEIPLSAGRNNPPEKKVFVKSAQHRLTEMASGDKGSFFQRVYTEEAKRQLEAMAGELERRAAEIEDRRKAERDSSRDSSGEEQKEELLLRFRNLLEEHGLPEEFSDLLEQGTRYPNGEKQWVPDSSQDPFRDVKIGSEIVRIKYSRASSSVTVDADGNASQQRTFMLTIAFPEGEVEVALEAQVKGWKGVSLPEGGGGIPKLRGNAIACKLEILGNRVGVELPVTSIAAPEREGSHIFQRISADTPIGNVALQHTLYWAHYTEGSGKNMRSKALGLEDRAVVENEEYEEALRGLVLEVDTDLFKKKAAELPWLEEGAIPEVEPRIDDYSLATEQVETFHKGEVSDFQWFGKSLGTESFSYNTQLGVLHLDIPQLPGNSASEALNRDSLSLVDVARLSTLDLGEVQKFLQWRLVREFRAYRELFEWPSLKLKQTLESSDEYRRLSAFLDYLTKLKTAIETLVETLVEKKEVVVVDDPAVAIPDEHLSYAILTLDDDGDWIVASALNDSFIPKDEVPEEAALSFLHNPDFPGDILYRFGNKVPSSMLVRVIDTNTASELGLQGQVLQDVPTVSLSSLS